MNQSVSTWRLFGMAVALSAALIWPLHARQASQQPTFRTEINVVQLDVTVLDKNRHPVRGLRAEDFTVIEDGKPRPVVGVLPVDVAVPAPRGAEAPWTRDLAPDVVSNDVDAQRLVVIIMDDAKTGMNGESYDPHIGLFGKRIARDVIDALGPQDLAAVVFTWKGRAQNFTTDRAKLFAAIDSFVPKDMPGVRIPLGCMFRGQGDCVTDTLRQVGDALPPMPPRRKVIVFIGQDLGHFERPCGGDTGLGDPGAFGQLTALQSALRTLQRANATIYAIDPSGLQVDRLQFCRSQNLRTLAELTGGKATSQTNAPWAVVPALIEETSSYYLVGFRTDRADGQFHPTTVRVNRPDVEVRTRLGYVAPGGKLPKLKQGVAPPTPVERALGSSVPSGDLPFTVSAVVIPEGGRKDALVSVLSHVRLPGVDTPGPRRVEVLVTAFDKDWKGRGSHHQTVEVSARPSAGAPAPVEVRSHLRLAPGRYELRVAADSGALTGNLFTDVEVPDVTKDALSLSSLVFEMPTATAAAKSATTALADAVPTVRREYTAADQVTAFLRAYQGGKRAPVAVPLAVRIENAIGERVLDESVQLAAAAFAANRAADYRLDLPLVRLAPGEYLLTIEATLDKKTLTRAVRFTKR